MRLSQLRIERFRGIRELNWTVHDRVVCLVGPGDATKTTILDAIALVASPRSSLAFVDADFYMADAAPGLLIEATYSELPAALMDERKFGMGLRGLTPSGEVVEEVGDHEPALTIRLAVDSSLDPQWTVVSAGHPEGRPIGPRDRALLSTARIGEAFDRQFSWARGTSLARAMGDPDQVAAILSTAYREAQATVDATDLSGLDRVVESARLAAEQVGAGPLAERLDVRLEISPASGSGLSLHIDGVPLTRVGLGTRRLLATGIELRATPTGAVVCLDEVEYGLEPHRLRHLLATLRVLVGENGTGTGQVIFTTHSPLVLELLGTTGLHVVRTDHGRVAVQRVPDSLIALVRGNPSALLARRTVVCEGRTEVGLLLGASRSWAQRHNGRQVTHAGTDFVDGGGRTVAPQRALQLRALGYPVLVLGDGDEPLVPSAAELEAAGIPVVVWADNLATEQRVATDCGWDTVRALAELVATEIADEQSLVNVMLETTEGKDAIARLGMGRELLGTTIQSLLEAGMTESEFRQAFGRAAKKKPWFKSFDHGSALGVRVAADTQSATRDIGAKLRVVEEWSYAGD